MGENNFDLDSIVGGAKRGAYIKAQNEIVKKICSILSINKKDYDYPIGIWARLIKKIRAETKASGSGTEQLKSVLPWVEKNKDKTKKWLDDIAADIKKKADARKKTKK